MASTIKNNLHYRDFTISGTTRSDGLYGIGDIIGSAVPVIARVNSGGMITFANGSSTGYAPFIILQDNSGVRQGNVAFTATIRCIVGGVILRYYQYASSVSHSGMIFHLRGEVAA